MEYSSVASTVGDNGTEYIKIYEGKSAIAVCSNNADAEHVLLGLRSIEENEEQKVIILKLTTQLSELKKEILASPASILEKIFSSPATMQQATQ